MSSIIFKLLVGVYSTQKVNLSDFSPPLLLPSQQNFPNSLKKGKGRNTNQAPTVIKLLLKKVETRMHCSRLYNTRVPIWISKLIETKSHWSPQWLRMTISKNSPTALWYDHFDCCTDGIFKAVKQQQSGWDPTFRQFTVVRPQSIYSVRFGCIWCITFLIISGYSMIVPSFQLSKCFESLWNVQIHH